MRLGRGLHAEMPHPPGGTPPLPHLGSSVFSLWAAAGAALVSGQLWAQGSSPH